MRTLKQTFLLLILLILSTSHAAETISPYKISPKVDYPLIASSFFLGVLPQVFGKELSNKNSQTDFNKDNVNTLDRTFINGTCDTCGDISDVFVVAIPLTSLGYLSNRHLETSAYHLMWEDYVLFAQGLSMTGAFGQIVRHSFKRPRPYLYNNNPNDPRRDQEDKLSFFSGHTASSFTSATMFAQIIQKRFPEENHTKLTVGLYSLASLVGAGRILSGDHFFTDVLTGAVVGTTVGYLVPYFHERDTKSYQVSLFPVIDSKTYSVQALINF